MTRVLLGVLGWLDESNIGIFLLVVACLLTPLSIVSCSGTDRVLVPVQQPPAVRLQAFADSINDDLRALYARGGRVTVWVFTFGDSLAPVIQVQVR